MKKYNIGIIGLGTIAYHYRQGLETNSHFKLVAVSDHNPNAISIQYYDVPYYKYYIDMLNNESIDLVIIATPPSTHYQIAIDAFNQGVGVLVEKPAVTNLDDLQQLINIAQHKKLIFDCIFHWEYANEIMYYLKHQDPNTKILSFETTIMDPYTLNDKKTIKDSKVSLHGAWFDSGINALSMITLFLPLEDYTCVQDVIFKDPLSNEVYYTKKIYKKDNQRVQITINWRNQISFKQSIIKYDNHTIKIIHHKELIYMNQTLVYDGGSTDRLSSHYNNFFNRFDETSINHKRLLDVHKILFAGKG